MKPGGSLVHMFFHTCDFNYMLSGKRFSYRREGREDEMLRQARRSSGKEWESKSYVEHLEVDLNQQQRKSERERKEKKRERVGGVKEKADEGNGHLTEWYLHPVQVEKSWKKGRKIKLQK